MRFLHEDIDLELKGRLSDDMSDKEFFSFCTQNDNQRIERDENGQIFIMAPVGLEGGKQNGIIFGELYLWVKSNKNGICFDSSTGFTLPDKSVRSPDASWIPNDKWSIVSQKDRKTFAAICPDFVIELKSNTDSLRYLKGKMLKWIENGCQLAWLIIPEKEEAHIYRADGSIEIKKGFQQKLLGENILPGFEFDLSSLK